jgi:hypothetical protein
MSAGRNVQLLWALILLLSLLFDAHYEERLDNQAGETLPATPTPSRLGPPQSISL